eukprot:jgi/Botrbrau1/20036/Bobra.200_1s0041.1
MYNWNARPVVPKTTGRALHVFFPDVFPDVRCTMPDQQIPKRSNVQNSTCLLLLVASWGTHGIPSVFARILHVFFHTSFIVLPSSSALVAGPVCNVPSFLPSLIP